MLGLTSAAPFLALLEDAQEELQVTGLNRLESMVNDFWPEISESIEKVEVLYENEDFKQRKLAALLASKVFFHLGEFTDAMSYALGAGELFDVNGKSEYNETLVGKFIDDYIERRVKLVEGKGEPIHPGLEAIANKMFARCFEDGQYKQVLGIALESHRLDMVEQAINKSPDPRALLDYCLHVSRDLVPSRTFREQVLEVVVKIYRDLKIDEYLKICECYTALRNSTGVADILKHLLSQNTVDSQALCYQIGFELFANATQQFLRQVREQIPVPDAPADAMQVDQGEGRQLSPPEKLRKILSGDVTIGLHLEFLHRNNNTDLSILRNIRQSTDARSSFMHNATVFANAAMHCGTTIDVFLRDNLDWLSRATHWAKFSATAGIGVIHKGHLSEGRQILSPYLPQGGGSASPYSEGGALYALGLIHANHGEEVTDYLVTALSNASSSEVVQHGACLGLGLASMATGNLGIFEVLKEVLFADSAVAGEAAGVAIGLAMLGSGNEEVIDMLLAYSHDTSHEKTIRGCALGMALSMYGREEGCNALVDQLLLDKDPILRYGACFTLGLAYTGTANNSAIRRLLHVAVSDVSDDVRRAAVMCLGFLLYNDPGQMPRLVSLLAESYNPHVRYGAAMALGLSCAGTGLKAAVELLDPMTADPTDFVRQGALIALSLIFIQRTKQQEPKVDGLRKMLQEKISDKHEELLCKFGAILASGILDAGGRNVSISLRTSTGQPNLLSNVGLALFTQYWHWYPFTHMLSLSFQPTAVIGLTPDLKMPEFVFKSNAKPSLFAYPPEQKPPKVKQAKKVETAVLSFSKKKTPAEKEKEEKEKKEKEQQEMDKMEVDEPEPKANEPEFEIIHNPARITPAQFPLVTFDVDERYTPIMRSYGIVMLKDNKPEQEVVLVRPKAPVAEPAKIEEDEPKPHADFEWTE